MNMQMMIKKLEYDNRNKQYSQCTFLIKTSNIFNLYIVIGLIAGHVLVCHMGTPEAVGPGHAR